MTYKFDKML